MERIVVFFYCIFAVILLLGCSSDSENIRKEGCINKNTLRIVVFLSKSSLPAGKINNDIISKEAVKIADQRCHTIINNALALNKKQHQSESYVVSWKLVLVEKKKDGYMGIVDYTVHDDIESLLQCR